MARLFTLISAFALCFALCGCEGLEDMRLHADLTIGETPEEALVYEQASLEELPAFAGEEWVTLNGNEPSFDLAAFEGEAFEAYSGLDELGRCGVACALLGPDTLPTEERGDISEIEPSGWVQAYYDMIEDGALYNRSHLIMFALGGENDPRNLITGTREMNSSSMLRFENQVLEYVVQEGGRVLYRVTPLFEGDNLVASAVQMEALSVDDGGEGICFNVLCFNVQPGFEIDYATGESWDVISSEEWETGEVTYILNTKSERFHRLDCDSVVDMNEESREEFRGTREDAIAYGYKPCGACQP